MSAIPLSASSPSISLTLGLGLRAELDLGLDILKGDGDMSAGAFVDLPSLKVTISNLAGVNKECKPISNIASLDQALSHAFPNLTNIVPEVDIGVGLRVGAELNMPEANFHTSVGTQTQLAGTAFTLPTACLSFDSSKKTFASPTVTSSTTGGSPTETGKSEGDGGARGAKAKSDGRRLSGELAIWWMGFMLTSVSLVFLSF